jgi:hypothetical protein
MEQGQYKGDDFGNPNQGGAANPGSQANPGGQPYPGGQPSQGVQPPFIPARAESGPVKQSQAKAIIILLVCILAVNVATFVTQNFLSPRGMTFSGGPGFGSGGMVTQGNDSGAQQQQSPPDFSQQEGETPPNFEQQEDE